MHGRIPPTKCIIWKDYEDLWPSMDIPSVRGCGRSWRAEFTNGAEHGTMIMDTNDQSSLERTVCFSLWLQSFEVVQYGIVFLTNGCRRLYCLAVAARIYGNGALNKWWDSKLLWTHKYYVKIATGHLTSISWMRHFQRSLPRVLLTSLLTSLKPQSLNYLDSVAS